MTNDWWKVEVRFAKRKNDRDAHGVRDEIDWRKERSNDRKRGGTRQELAARFFLDKPCVSS
jgi:hypothetical protein